MFGYTVSVLSGLDLMTVHMFIRTNATVCMHTDNRIILENVLAMCEDFISNIIEYR
jgi:hypothetical protein